MNSWLKFSNLCRQAGKPKLAQPTPQTSADIPVDGRANNTLNKISKDTQQGLDYGNVVSTHGIPYLRKGFVRRR